jgi:hypothetical protein
VDGHRRYADEPEKPSWYSGQGPATGQNPYEAGESPYDSGVYERPSGAFRLPDQRSADDYAPDPVTSTGSHARPPAEPPTRSSVRGPEYPAVRPNGANPAVPTTHSAPPVLDAPPQPGYNDPTSLVAPIQPPDRAREAVYSTRRPASAVVVAIATAVLMVPVIRLLVSATFTGTPVAHSIVPAVLLTLGLPLTGVGLYALAGGGRPQNRDTWLRPPVAYLPAGLLLVLAAAIAVG